MKYLAFLLLITISISISTSTSTVASAENKKVVMLISQGFYAPEYFKPLKILKAAGVEVTTAAKYMIPIKPDQRQVKEYKAVMPDILFKQIKVEDYDAILFAGGNGAWEDFFPNNDVHKNLTDFLNAGKITALLCSATGLLGVAHNLDGKSEPVAKGRRVTGYKRVKGLLTELGKVEYLPGKEGQPFVVIDKNLITGRDPISAELFGETVLKQLMKKDK